SDAIRGNQLLILGPEGRSSVKMRHWFCLAVVAGLLPVLNAIPASWSPKAENRRPPREVTNSIGMKLALIPAGKFTMGSPKEEKGRPADEAQHEVDIAHAFYTGIHEVTQGQFEKVTGYNPSYFSASTKGKEGAAYLDWSKPGGGKDKVKDLGDTCDFPIENVSWDEAVEFCSKLSALTAEKQAGRKYRLPSDAEWEYACRGGLAT